MTVTVVVLPEPGLPGVETGGIDVGGIDGIDVEGGTPTVTVVVQVRASSISTGFAYARCIAKAAREKKRPVKATILTSEETRKSREVVRVDSGQLWMDGPNLYTRW